MSNDTIKRSEDGKERMMTKEEAIYILRNTAFLAPSLEPIDEAIEMACEALKQTDAPQTDCTEALTLLWIKNMVTDEEFHRIDARLKCISCKWWNDTVIGGSECVSKECTYQPKDEPQTDSGDFADRLAYERGVKHAWEVAQKVFDSTVTFYEAEDVAKQIAKDEPQTDCAWK